MRNKQRFPSNTALKTLGFSTAYLHKLSSVLLNKTLQHLYGNHYRLQLKALAKKLPLVGVMRHLMKIFERQLLAADNRKYLQQFYRACLYIETGHYASDYSARLCKYYYLHCLKHTAVKERAYLDLKMQLEIANISINHDGGLSKLENKRTFSRHEQDIIAIENKCRKKGLYNILMDALLVRITLYLDVQNHIADSLPCFDEALLLAQMHSKVIPAQKVISVKLKQAKAFYFLNRFEESFNVYESMNVVGNVGPGAATGADVAKYLQVALVTGRYPVAAGLLDSFFTKYAGANNSAGVMATLQQMKYFAYTAQWKNVIAIARQIGPVIKRFKLLQYFVESRIMHCAALFFINNRADAFELAEKTLKQLYAKKRPELDDFVVVFRLIKAFCKEGRLNPSLKQGFELYQTGAYRQYGELLNRMQASAMVSRG